MRFGAPYRLSSVGWPLSASVCRVGDTRRRLGVAPPCNCRSRCCASTADSAASAFISAGSQAFIVAARRPTISCPCGLSRQLPVMLLQPPLTARRAPSKRNCEGLARHHQSVDRLARRLGARLQRPDVALQAAHQRRVGGAAVRRGLRRGLRGMGGQGDGQGHQQRQAAGKRRTWTLRSVLGHQRQHPVGRVPRRGAAVAVELQQAAFADAELLAPRRPHRA